MEKNMKYIISIMLLVFSLSVNAGWKQDPLGGFSKVHVYTPTEPPTLNIEKRPLLIALHGCAQTSDALLNANFEGPADNHNAIIALPEAQYKAGFSCWDYWGTTKSRTAKDYKNILGLVDILLNDNTKNIDPNQVYISGLSSGGAFAMNLSCMAPDVFAGMGILAGPSAGTDAMGAFSHQGTPEIIANNCNNMSGDYNQYFDTQIMISGTGTKDYTVPMTYAPQNAEAMAIVYGIPYNLSNSIIISEGSNNNAKERLVENRIALLELTNEGHNWSGGIGAFGGYVGNASININEYMLDYFKQNNMRIEQNPYIPRFSDFDAIVNGSQITVTANVDIADDTELTDVVITIDNEEYIGQLNGSIYIVSEDLADGEYTVNISANVVVTANNEYYGNDYTINSTKTVEIGEIQPERPFWCYYINEDLWVWIAACQ